MIATTPQRPRHSCSTRVHHRRGTVLVAVVAALVLLQLIIVGVVVSGARDHDLTARRAETMRAFYAAEAGMNMAIRELMLDTDEDGDGGIGTVSDDSNDATDPAIGGGSGRVRVTSDMTGAVTTLTSNGRAGIARRSLAAVLEQ